MRDFFGPDDGPSTMRHAKEALFYLKEFIQNPCEETWRATTFFEPCGFGGYAFCLEYCRMKYACSPGTAGRYVCQDILRNTLPITVRLSCSIIMAAALEAAIESVEERQSDVVKSPHPRNKQEHTVKR